MQRWLTMATLTVAAVLAPIAAHGAPADEVGYPDTAPGRHARAYFHAYNADAAAMRAFLATHADSASLRERPVDLRLNVWRDMRRNQGRLTPVRVLDSGPRFVEIAARSEQEGPVRMRFLCADAAPYGLLGVRIDQGDEADASARPADTAPAPNDDEEIVRRLTAALDSLSRTDRFAGAVLLDKGGTRLYAGAFGMASREGKRPNTLATRFNLGSINKLFTAVAIHQLAAAGKLTLDDPIDRYLPEYLEEKAAKITIRMLLEHRGGVPDFFNERFNAADRSRIRTLADWFALVKQEPLRFEPGTSQAYSNGGYLLLGMIVANVSGEDYYDYVRRHVYAPAGMTRSDHYAKDAHVENLAIGYTRRGASGDGWQPNIAGLPGRGSPAGGGYSTVEDLLRFADAMRSGKLPEPSEGRSAAGSIGLMSAGGSPGCNAFLQVEGPYTLVVLANLDPPAAERLGETVGGWIEGLAGGGGRPRVRVSAGGGGGH